jgi:hypothetical protein
MKTTDEEEEEERRPGSGGGIAYSCEAEKNCLVDIEGEGGRV